MAKQFLLLQQRKFDLQAEGRALADRIEADGRAMTDEERSRVAAIRAEMAQVEEALALVEETRTWERTAPAVERMPAQVKAEPDGFKSFGEQLQAVARAYMPGGSIDRRLMPSAAAGLNEAVGSEGGFMVQKDFATDLFAQAFGQSEILRRCRPMPISAGANGTKITMIDETSRANGSRWGGSQAYWAAEAATVTASQPKFRQVELDLKKLFGLAYATEENLQDAAQLEAVVRESFGEEMIFKAEDAVIEGTGAGQPLGILNAGCKIEVTKEAGQTADTIVAENIDKMWARMHPNFKRNAVWLINPDCWPQLASMSRAVGVGGGPAFMPMGGLSASPYATLYGKPLIEVEYASTVGDAGDIILADFSQYYLAQKNGVQAASSIHVRFIYDEMTFRFIWRLDGQPRFASALTPFKGSNTLAPFVTIAARA